MIITKQWLNDWIEISDISTQKICEVLNSIGLEVDSVTKCKIPQGVVVGFVEDKQVHGNAEKLSICQVNIGEEILQIVCGAKNVQKGQYIALATVGTTLPNGLKIKPAKLRGESSMGMICSSVELGLPKLNDGIMVLDDSIGELKLGKNLSEYELLNDDVIEIELTANRGDCLSIHGVARDLSVALNKPLKKQIKIEEDENLLGIGRVLSLQTDEKLNSSLIYKVLKYKQANQNILMDLRLKIAQVEYDNPLQRIISYASYSTGVLLKIYNLEDFMGEKKANIEIKKDKNGFDCVYGKSKLMSKIGFIQEKKYELKEGEVVLEASYVEPDFISLLGMRHKNEKRDLSFYNSSRGSEPDLSFGIDYVEYLCSSEKHMTLYGGEQSALKEKEAEVINVQISQINKIIGHQVPKNQIVNILKGLGFELTIRAEQDLMSVVVPAYRHDITGKQDICEEIVRMVGIDNINAKPYVYAEKTRSNKALIDFERKFKLRLKSVAAGYFESVHYVFDDEAKMQKYGFKTIKKDKKIANPITNELNTLRATLALHLLEATSLNTKNSKRKISLFEIGEVFDENRVQSIKMAWVFSGEKEDPNVFNHGKPDMIDLRYFVDSMASILGNFELKKAKPDNLLYSPYEYAEMFINEQKIGFLARVHAKAESEFSIMPTYVCEIDFDALSFEQKLASAYAKFPTSSRDFSFLVDKNLEYNKIKECIDALKLDKLIKFYPIDRFESEQLGDNISLSISFVFQDKDKTLEDEEVNIMSEQILNILNEKLGITLR